MSGIKVGVQWSASKENQFVVYGPDISLYEVEPLSPSHHNHDNGTPISDTTQSNLLAVNKDITYMKCLAWSPHPLHEDLFAVGQVNGRVLLASCSQSSKSALIGKEFAPRHARQCTYLSWHRRESNLLVEGLENSPRFKSHSCIYVWDVSVCTEIPMSPDKMRTSFSESGAITKPYLEIGLSDSSYSFSWLFNNPMCFVTGVSSKMLKIYDMREPSKPYKSTPTKAIYGVCVDPLQDNRMASYTESSIQVWDMRSFERPMLTMNEQKPIVKIDWCPTRLDSLACLTKDNPVIKVYDIRHHAMGTDDVEPFMFERNIIPRTGESIFSFSWHPTHENRVLAVTSDSVVRDVTMYERVASAWSPGGSLLWSCGRKAVVSDIDDALTKDGQKDISTVMRNRATQGYASHVEQIWQNAELAKGDVRLQNFWLWLDSVKTLIEENKKLSRPSNITKFVGVKALLQGQESNPGVAFSRDRSTFKVSIYECELRKQALQLAGWDQDPDVLESRLLRIEAEGAYERAAAIALFNLKLRQSLDILHRGASKNDRGASLTAVAMALSGYTQEKSGLWRETCSHLTPQLNHPYLRAMFAFLLAEDDSWHTILTEKEMALRDRVGFACTYLNDARLADFVDKYTAELVQTGNLDGILLTGMSEEGLYLLQSYVNQTGDVQTAAVAAVFTGSPALIRHARVQHWIDSYRKLLDRWSLWHERCEFDILHHGEASNTRPPLQVFISCNFCGKSISCVLPPTARRMPQFAFSMGSPSPNKSRVTSCPACRKPLPRCALCLRHMGTTSGYLHQKHLKTPHLRDKNTKMCEFNDWFTWCQTCRHGGHSSHISQWFTEHTECPVSGCVCRCMSLDSVSRERSLSTNKHHAIEGVLRRTSIKATETT